MKSDAIERALGLTNGKGAATDALNAIPDGGKPDDLPEESVFEFLGPPEQMPPDDAGNHSDFELPVAAAERSPETFPSRAEFPLVDEDMGQAPEVFDYIFI